MREGGNGCLPAGGARGRFPGMIKVSAGWLATHIKAGTDASNGGPAAQLGMGPAVQLSKHAGLACGKDGTKAEGTVARLAPAQ